MKQFQRCKEPAKNMAVHPMVRWIWRHMNLQRASQEDVAERAGISSSTMRKWRRGIVSPRVADIEAVINVLGGEIVVRMKPDDNP